MKNVMMILFLLMGMGIHEISAQNCPGYCPPGCCILSCCHPSNRASASATEGQSGEVTLASFILTGNDPISQDSKMSKKEMKACMASCTAMGHAGPSDNIRTADAGYSSIPVQTAASTSSSPCQPGCMPSSYCKFGTAASSQTSSNQPARVKEKS